MNREDWPVVPGYTLHGNIGSGGFGVVFLAEEKSLLRKRRAIKICWPSPLQAAEGVHERFLRESKTLSDLNHPNIVSYINSGFTEGEPKPFVVMDFVEGINLQKESVDTIEHACGIVLSLLETLEYCHSRDVIHRDIKPSNVIIRAVDQSPVLVDFGLSINLASIGDRVSKEPPGSPGYMAPELIADPLMLDVRLDIYSIGVLLYELIAKRLPDPLSPKPLAYFKTDADTHLDEIIRACLSHVSQRIPDAKTLRLRLSNWMELHRQRVAHMGRLSARGQALRKGFLDGQQRLRKDKEASARFAGEMSRLAEGQINTLVNQVLLLFEEAVESLQKDVPDISIVAGDTLHSNPASRIIADQAKQDEILDLVKLSAFGHALSFAALKFAKLSHPWTKEVLFTADKNKDVGMLDIHRGGVPSPRVMQPLFVVYSQDGDETESRWLHLAIVMVFEEADFVDISSLKFVAEHHPRFTKIDNLLVVGSSPEDMHDAIWRVVEWFFNSQLTNS